MRAWGCDSGVATELASAKLMSDDNVPTWEKQVQKHQLKDLTRAGRLVYPLAAAAAVTAVCFDFFYRLLLSPSGALTELLIKCLKHLMKYLIKHMNVQTQNQSDRCMLLQLENKKTKHIIWKKKKQKQSLRWSGVISKAKLAGQMWVLPVCGGGKHKCRN